MLSLLLRKRTVSTQAALKLLDDANAAIHYNRELLADLRSITSVRALPCSTTNLPSGVLEPAVRRNSQSAAEYRACGRHPARMPEFNAEQGAFGEGETTALVEARIQQLCARHRTVSRAVCRPQHSC